MKLGISSARHMWSGYQLAGGLLVVFLCLGLNPIASSIEISKDSIVSVEDAVKGRNSLWTQVLDPSFSRMLGMLYETEQWGDLLSGLKEKGADEDLTYLYLGRISEHVGERSLALRLYQVAVDHPNRHRCYSSNCHNIDSKATATLFISKLAKSSNVVDREDGQVSALTNNLSNKYRNEAKPIISEANASFNGSLTPDSLDKPIDPSLLVSSRENVVISPLVEGIEKEDSATKIIAPVAPRFINNKRALIVGNDLYKNVPKLQNARFDAESIAEEFKKLNYQVVLKTDLSQREFQGVLRNFKSTLQGGDEVVFFFAGHGVQINSSNYLLPVDIGNQSESQIQDEGIPLQRILDDFREQKVRFSLAIVDACRDNPFVKAGRSIGGRGLASTAPATGQMIIFSAGVGQQALDKLGSEDKERNGLFTRVFLQKLRDESKGSVLDVVRDVRVIVAGLASSVGHEQVPALYDQTLGDFFFAPEVPKR